MTDQEIREAADRYVTINTDGEIRRMYGHHISSLRSFTAGAKWAEKEAYNKAIDDAIKTLNSLAIKDGIIKFLIEELKKIRK